MTAILHNGDLAEYQGSVKMLAGCRCEVIDRLTRVCIHVRLADGRLVTRWVKPESLKRLGGGGDRC
jgi:hypothetical protein